jgi:hypothetical protein
MRSALCVAAAAVGLAAMGSVASGQGSEAPRRVDGLVWHRTLASAEAAAQGARGGRGKPIFVLRMLGDLCGAT